MMDSVMRCDEIIMDGDNIYMMMVPVTPESTVTWMDLIKEKKVSNELL